MPTERELAISPIVQESVQHNTQVYSPPTPLATRFKALQLLTDSHVGHLKYPLPDRLSFRRRLWHPRSRVLLWLPLLHSRHFLRLGTHLGHISKGQTRGLLPRSVERAVGRRCTKWRHEFCTDVDTILWVSTGLTGS